LLPVADEEFPPGAIGVGPPADGSVGGGGGGTAPRHALATALFGAHVGVPVGTRSPSADGWLLAGIRRRVATTAVRSSVGRNG